MDLTIVDAMVIPLDTIPLSVFYSYLKNFTSKLDWLEGGLEREIQFKLYPSIGDRELLARAVVDVDEHQQHGEEAQRDGLPQKGQPSEKFVQCL